MQIEAFELEVTALLVVEFSPGENGVEVPVTEDLVLVLAREYDLAVDDEALLLEDVLNVYELVEVDGIPVISLVGEVCGPVEVLAVVDSNL